MNCGPISFWSVGKVRRAKAWVGVGENLRDWNLWIWGIKKTEEKKSHV